MPNESDKSYNCKFISYIIVPIILLFLSNDVSAITVRKGLRPQTLTVTCDLALKIKKKINQYPNIICGIYIKPSWIKESPININGDSQFPAASLIKIPVAVVLLSKIDQGKISWNEVLTLKRNNYAAGAGLLRTKRPGTKIKLRQVFKLMLTISDNTATNMMIERLGGIASVNAEIKNLGLTNTKVVNYLGDFKGTNKTSPRDLVNIFEKSLEGDLLSKSSRGILKSTLLSVKNKSLIKKGLGKYTGFAHKTGTIGICVGDAGIIYLPFRKRVGISIIVKRQFNSLNGQRIIREISRLVYESLK